MKSVVIYFSQTGNTLQIARAIQAGIQEEAGHCDLASMKEISAQVLAVYDLIGVGSPVWHCREPANVGRFIEYGLNEVENKHGFTFCTHGMLPGRFLARVVPFMAQRGLTVVGWKNWYCSVTMPEKPKPYFTDGHPDAIDLAEAHAFGREMAQRSRRITAGEGHLVPVLEQGQAYDALYPGAAVSSGPPTPEQLRFINLRDFDFRIDTAKCAYPKCTLCVDHCPTNSINMAATPPVMRKTCDRCWYCEQICPRGAIEADWQPLASFVQANVIPRFAQAAQLAADQKRFRPLVPLDQVVANPSWYELKKPPRLKLVTTKHHPHPTKE